MYSIFFIAGVLGLIALVFFFASLDNGSRDHRNILPYVKPKGKSSDLRNNRNEDNDAEEDEADEDLKERLNDIVIEEINKSHMKE